jgi:hypothetical protein
MSRLKNLALDRLDNARQQGLTIHVGSEPTVPTTLGVECLGFFDDETSPPRIHVASPDHHAEDIWSLTALHEYCHFLQWKEGSPLMDAINENMRIKTKGQPTIIDNPSNLFDLWIDLKVSLTTKEVDRCLKAVINLEADCESRVLKLLRTNRLHDVAEAYIAQANAYILSFYATAATRSWERETPFTSPSIIEFCLKEIPSTVQTFQENWRDCPAIQAYSDLVIQTCYNRKE